MNKNLLIFVLFASLFFCFEELYGQSVFDDYSTAISTLDAAPYANLSLDAMDYNPAGNVFLRNGFELSLSSLWPRWQSMENKNTFKVRDYEVNRICKDYSKWGVPNPSARISFRHNNCAIAFSYAHGESRYEGDGNTYFDEVTQTKLNDQIVSILLAMSLQNFFINKELNELADQLNQQYGVGVQAPYPRATYFPFTLLSSDSRYGCKSDCFSTGYSHRFIVGGDESWEWLSLYGGLKYQRLSLRRDTYIGLFCVDTGLNSIFPLSDYYSKYVRFYSDLAKKIPEFSDYFSTSAQSYQNMVHALDTAFLKFSRGDGKVAWGIAGEIGIDYVRPYWNVAAKMEFGCLPFKFSLGGTRYFGRWQISAGTNIGYVNDKFKIYKELFGQQLDGTVGGHWYGDMGAEVAYRNPRSYWTLKCGLACGVNKDVLLNNGYEFFLAKHNTLLPSLGFQWNASSLVTLIGGVRIQLPIGGKKIDMNGIYDSDAICKVNPEYQVSIGFVAHLE